MTSSHEHWNEVYRTRSTTEVSWYQPEPTLSLAWILEAVPDRDSAILDVGAGASLLVDRLLDHGYRRPALLDVAATALDEVRERLGERVAEVDFHEVDVLRFDPPRTFDLWHDRAVLHFLREAEDRLRYGEVLRRALSPHGHALIATFAPDGPTRCSGLEVVRHDCASLLEIVGPEFVCTRSALETHRTPGGGEQLFSYCLLKRGDPEKT